MFGEIGRREPGPAAYLCGWCRNSFHASRNVNALMAATIKSMKSNTWPNRSIAIAVRARNPEP